MLLTLASFVCKKIPGAHRAGDLEGRRVTYVSNLTFDTVCCVRLLLMSVGVEVEVEVEGA